MQQPGRRVITDLTFTIDDRHPIFFDVAANQHGTVPLDLAQIPGGHHHPAARRTADTFPHGPHDRLFDVLEV